MGRRRTRYIKETELGDTLSERLDNRKASIMMSKVAVEQCTKRAKSLAEGLNKYAKDTENQQKDNYVEEFLSLLEKAWQRYLTYIKDMDYTKYVSLVERKLIFKNAIENAAKTVEIIERNLRG